MRDVIVIGCCAAGLLLAACSDDSLVDGLFTEAEWQKVQSFSPLPSPPPSPTNRYADNLAVAELGQRLWFEKRYAGPIMQGSPAEGGLGNIGDTQRVSCADCHNPQHWFQDTRSIPNTTSLGTMRTRRNAPSMVNAVYYEWGNWAGSHDTFWKQGANSPESLDNFNSDRLRYAHVIYTYYRDHYNALFDPDLDPALDPSAPDAARFPESGRPKRVPTDPDGVWEMMAPGDQHVVNTIMANCGKALEAYERRLISSDSAFDRYVAGNYDALSASAKRGLKLFIGKAACESCHKEQTFTDQEFHNTGVTQTQPFDDGRLLDVKRVINDFDSTSIYSDDPEFGRQKLVNLTPTESMRGQFRTKSLRHIAETGPYFHNGSAKSLTEVVRFYNQGGGSTGSFPGVKDERLVPLNLSENEIVDLVEFLKTLTGQPVPVELTMDRSAQMPVTRAGADYMQADERFYDPRQRDQRATP